MPGTKPRTQALDVIVPKLNAGRRVIRALLRLLAPPTPPTDAELEAVGDVLRNASPGSVDRVARAAHAGDPKRLQAELVAAGVPLSAAPPVGFELRRRFVALLVGS